MKNSACATRGSRRQGVCEIVTDEAKQPIAVQIDYTDWLKIERSLNLTQEDDVSDLSRYSGVISLTGEPLAYQARVRSDWS